MHGLMALLSRLLFGVGLVVSGMTEPAKVIGFLDVAGAWDPTLAFVMGGAICVHAPLRAVVARRGAPLVSERFHWPTAAEIDARLILGAALFGIGWGMAGYCPGPAITSGAVSSSALWLVGGMVLGMGIHGLVPTPESDD